MFKKRNKTNQLSGEIELQKSVFYDLPRLLRKSPSGMFGFALIMLAVFAAVFADVLTPYAPDGIDLMNMSRPPAWVEGGSPEHILGTDVLGRDVLSRILAGSRVSLLVGLFSVFVAGFIGTVFGILSGYYGGWIDAVIMRITDSFHAIPQTLFAMVVLSMLGSGIPTTIFVIGITTWPFYARMIRSEVLGIKAKEYIKAAKTIGTSDFSIMFRHVLPNVLPSFIVVSTLSVATSILAESTLSFLGVGIQPPLVSWGVILSDGRDYLTTSWWVCTFPGIAISLTVLGTMMFGNWIRDVLDPKLQGIL